MKKIKFKVPKGFYKKLNVKLVFPTLMDFKVLWALQIIDEYLKTANRPKKPKKK